MSIRIPDGRYWEELTLDEQGDVVVDWLKHADAAGVPVVEWLAEPSDEEQLGIAA